MLIAGIAVAGAIGATSRFLLDSFVQERSSTTRPLGTFAVNVTGSLVLGFLTGLALYHAFSPDAKTVLGTGFCGAFTTFSTFTYETVRLAEDGDGRGAGWNVAASLLLPTIAAAAGFALAAI